MKWKFEQEFRKDKPETIGEIDSHFDLDNYKDWLEEQLSEARSKLHQPTVISTVCENPHCHDGIVIAMFGENYRCGICEDKQTDL